MVESYSKQRVEKKDTFKYLSEEVQEKQNRASNNSE